MPSLISNPEAFKKFQNPKQYIIMPMPIHIGPKTELKSRWTVPFDKFFIPYIWHEYKSVSLLDRLIIILYGPLDVHVSGFCGTPIPCLKLFWDYLYDHFLVTQNTRNLYSLSCSYPLFYSQNALCHHLPPLISLYTGRNCFRCP